VEVKKNTVNSIIYLNNRLKNMQMNKVLTMIVSNANFASNQKILNHKMHFITTFLLSIRIAVQFAKFRKKIPQN